MKYTKTEIKKEMNKFKVKFKKGMTKCALVAKLAKEVDYRYKLWGKTVKQLKSLAVGKLSFFGGNKETIVKALWDKYTEKPVVSAEPEKPFLASRPDIINKLEANKVSYDTQSTKQQLLDLLVENVDFRYQMWSMTIDRIRRVVSDAGRCYTGSKVEVIGKLWKLRDTLLMRALAGFQFIKIDTDAVFTEADPPMNREPISPFLKLRTGGSFNTLDDMVRIKMIIDAENYGNGYSIRCFMATLEEMVFYDNLPEYIDGNSKHFRKSQYYLAYNPIGHRRQFARKFAEYYNKYIRGNIDRIEQAYEDLESKRILTYSSASRDFGKGLVELWNKALGYSPKDNISPVIRMVTLDRLRPKLDTTVWNHIDTVKADKFVQKGIDLYNMRTNRKDISGLITQEDLDNVDLLGSRSQIAIMYNAANHWAFRARFFPGVDSESDYMPSFETALKYGPSMDDEAEGGFPGGQYRESMVRLFALIDNNINQIGSSRDVNMTLQKILRNFLTISEEGECIN